MKARFLGPLDIVTGSCTWMRDEANGWNFLVDCGMQQGERSAQDWNQRNWPFRPSDIQFVVLTHAHLDHCGLLPKLYRDGFRGTVYCTAETAELAKIVLEDAARQADSVFRSTDVARIGWHEHSALSFHRPLPVGHDLFLRYYRSGHIAGAVSVAVLWGPRGEGQRSIVFSGDLGPNAEECEHLPFMRHRMVPTKADFAVIESTYGGVIRTEDDLTPEARCNRLRELVDATVASNGVLVLPCFAIGRAQDVLFDLHWLFAESPDQYANVDVVFDLPMAERVNRIVAKAMRRTEANGRPGKVRPMWLGKQMFRWFELDQENPQHVKTLFAMIDSALGLTDGQQQPRPMAGNAVAREWRPIARKSSQRGALPKDRPVVLVTGGGMCDGGPAAEWLPMLLPDPRVTVALPGYVSPASIGGQLLQLATTPLVERRRHTGVLRWSREKQLPVHQVAASITRLSGYSAHADQAGLLTWLFWEYAGVPSTTGKVVFVQHGTKAGRTELQKAIQARASELGHEVSVLLPDDPTVDFDLDASAAAVSASARRAALLREQARIAIELAEFDDKAA